MIFDIADPTTVSRLIGVVVPLLVALVTKKVASQGLKGTLNLILSAVGGSTAYLVTADGAYDLKGFINAVINTFIVSTATYYSIYKSTGITDTLSEKTADFGLGPKPTLETAEKEEDGGGITIVVADSAPPAGPELDTTPDPTLDPVLPLKPLSEVLDEMDAAPARPVRKRAPARKRVPLPPDAPVKKAAPRKKV